MQIRMEDVVLNLNLAPRITGSTMDIKCPNCGNNCLHFDFRQQIFACPVCAEYDNVGGGIMDAWAYFRGIQGLDQKDTRKLAKKDLEKFYGNNPTPRRAYKEIEKDKPKEIASEIERHKFFTKILSMLTLSQDHYQNLQNRGMDDAQIRESQIKSFKVISSKELQKEFPKQDLSCYPGFFMIEGKPYMVGSRNYGNYGSGMLIPEVSIDGKIQGFQIRRDTNEKKKRYITLSSAKYGGVSGPTYIHYSNHNSVPDSECIITEGPLKGTIINYFTNIPVIAVPGVSSQKYLNEALEKLQKRGLKRVKIAFDMDFYEKKGVQKALCALRKKLSDLEIPFTQLEWKSGYKGYDDHLAAKASE